SLSEGLPLALLEAMFAARPIVASAVGDVPVALASGAVGLLVPPGDSAALAGALQRLLVQPFEAQRLGHSAQARAAAEYGIGRMVQRYAELYGRLLARRPESGSAADPNTSGVEARAARAVARTQQCDPPRRVPGTRVTARP